MGLLDIFKRKNQDAKPLERKAVLIDNLYLIYLPQDWTPFPSDRFRTVNASKTINFSITNFGKPINKDKPFTFEQLKAETFANFGKFVTEGGYEAIDDREAISNYVYQAFKVDDETQYYYYTSRETIGQTIRMGFILRENGNYNPSTKKMLLEIGESIMLKVS